MSFARIESAQTSLLKAAPVTVEVDLGKGLHSFSIVGLPDKAVEESKDRVSAAIKNSGFKSPKNRNQKVVISLAPADVKKEGPAFDLAIALGYLLAAEDIAFDPKGKAFLGELSLDGTLRPVSGVLPIAEDAKRRGVLELYVPTENAEEAALIEDIDVFAVPNLSAAVAHLNTKALVAEGSDMCEPKRLEPVPRTEIRKEPRRAPVDFSDVKGQESAKRGLMVAAAGGHNVAMWGPPGTGKSMLAKAFAGILPSLSFDEALEATGIHSVAGVLRETLITEPPLRSPHHTSSHTALVGGGAVPKPGEITLAHRGILFLDELAEFERRAIDSLRQPLEDRVISVSRVKGSAHFPAHFILIATMNPCPCGNRGVKGKECTCGAAAIERYKRKISGPIVDRIDIWLEVSAVDHKSLSNGTRDAATSDTIKERVTKARKTQAARFKGKGKPWKTNAEMDSRSVAELVTLAPDVKEALDAAAGKLDLSARSYHRIMKLARTIADLEGSAEIALPHMLEALQYRPKRM
jgi:magnesium chelatase family protein